MIVSTKDFEIILNKINSGFNNFTEAVVPCKVSPSPNKPPILRFEKLKKDSKVP